MGREVSMETRELVVSAGNHDRERCPLNFTLELSPDEEVGSVKLKEKESGEDVPVQWEQDRSTGRVALSWILDNLEAGDTKSYVVSLEKGQAEGKDMGVRLVQAEEKVEVWIEDGLFTAYHFGGGIARPFLYPLVGPGGLHLTRRLAQKGDKELDHHHHRSFWVAHGDVNGVDNWSEGEGHGRTIHRVFEQLKEGMVFARIRARGDWVSRDGEKVLEEIRDLKFYNLPHESRIIDMDLYLKATEEDVTFGDTKEGGIASLRVMPSMEVRNGGRIENSYGGINEAETWGKRSHWCDYSGTVDGQTIGIALFDHPENFRHPTWWHVRDYGLMTANPFALSYYTGDPTKRGDHLLRHGEELRFTFRLFIHQGDATAGKVRARYHDYINPPVVELKG
ncbi:MAG TPA: hypothetical protein EYP53_08450 [Candidatus Latescibacteria bacterium]|nr:hypothetical protein [Candidatus Latescibacterota bacterium]